MANAHPCFPSVTPAAEVEDRVTSGSEMGDDVHDCAGASNCREATEAHRCTPIVCDVYAEEDYEAVSRMLHAVCTPLENGSSDDGCRTEICARYSEPTVHKRHSGGRDVLHSRAMGSVLGTRNTIRGRVVNLGGEGRDRLSAVPRDGGASGRRGGGGHRNISQGAARALLSLGVALQGGACAEPHGVGA